MLQNLLLLLLCKLLLLLCKLLLLSVLMLQKLLIILLLLNKLLLCDLLLMQEGKEVFLLLLLLLHLLLLLLLLCVVVTKRWSYVSRHAGQIYRIPPLLILTEWIRLYTGPVLNVLSVLRVYWCLHLFVLDHHIGHGAGELVQLELELLTVDRVGGAVDDPARHHGQGDRLRPRPDRGHE